jgi:hypothetical protein
LNFWNRTLPALTVLLCIAAFVMGGVHPMSFFFNQRIHRVSPGSIETGQAALPFTRWVEIEGEVVPGSIYEHCHRIYSRNLGDYRTYLIYAVRDSRGTVIVRDHIDMQVSDSACTPRATPILPVRRTVPVQGSDFRFFSTDNEAHVLGVPETVRVRGMLRYTLLARLPESGKAYASANWKTPFLVAHEEPSPVSNALFYAALLCFIALCWLNSRFGVEDQVQLVCALAEPGRIFAPGEQVPFSVTVNMHMDGLLIKDISAHLKATRESVFRTLTIHSQSKPLLQNRITQAKETLEFRDAFDLPSDLKNFKEPKDARSRFTEWKIIVTCDVRDKLAYEKEIRMRV